MPSAKLKFTDLVSELGSNAKKVRAKIKELGLSVSPRARLLSEKDAAALRTAFATKKVAPTESAEDLVKTLVAPKIELIKKAPVAQPTPTAPTPATTSPVVAAPTPAPVAPAPAPTAPTPTPAPVVPTPAAKPKPVAPTAQPTPATPQPAPTPTIETRKETPVAQKTQEQPAAPAEVPADAIAIPAKLIVKDFAAKIGAPVTAVISTLIQNGFMINLNQEIDFDTASLIAGEFNKKLVLSTEQTSDSSRLTGSDLKRLVEEKNTDQLVARPPIVTVMGHVDHGKTTLLDALRKTNVVEGEAGGITQSIGAYQVIDKGKSITFLDTPGHEAFIEMRQRGANVTDIVVLVVAANDGVRPQTIEAMNHAKAAGVPIIVAVNKIDLPEANIDRVKKEMSDIGLAPEGWGGNTVFVPVSAKKKIGIQELEDTILLVSELQELKANPNREAVGFVVESGMTAKEGPVATILVNTGTLRVGQHVVVGDTFGTIRGMTNYVSDNVTAAGPSMPVRIVGLNRVPRSGDILRVATSRNDARAAADQVAKEEKLLRLKRKMEEGEQKVNSLNILLRAESQGSLEALEQTLSALKLEGVGVNFIHKGVGEISESNIMLAATANAWVVGFNVKPSAQAEKLAGREKLTISLYDVIYTLVEETKKRISELVAPEILRHNLGELEILAVFRKVPGEMIVGGKVTRGSLKPGVDLEVFRGEEKVGAGKLKQLQRNRAEVNEVKAPDECGITYVGNAKIKVGDQVKAFTLEERRKTF